jgi:hypothetical protein
MGYKYSSLFQNPVDFEQALGKPCQKLGFYGKAADTGLVQNRGF